MGADDAEVAHLPQSMKDKQEKRARWHSSLSFILAAVGSAVGLGNVWRFPYLVSKHGGAPFLIPYILCLVFIGMPILLMELSLGQMFQGGDIEAFGRMNPRLRGIGLASVFGSFVIVTYYAVILSYAMIYFVYSFITPLPYASGDVITLESATDFFFNKVMKIGDVNNPQFSMSGEMVLALFILWIMVFCCIFNGVETAGWVVYVTVPLPVFLILVLLIRGAMLEGSHDGVKEYIGKWDGEKLKDLNMWVDATGQVFFTLSVCMGVMTAYSSHNQVHHQVGRDEKIISISDMLVALLGGFTVYCMLGFLAFKSGDTGMYDISSMSLAFVAYPTGISQVPGSNFWGIMFFLCLIMLGIDSAFSMIEAVTTVISDSWLAKRYNLGKPICSFIVCLLAFALGTMFTMDVGFYLLDSVDHYVNAWGMIFLGFMECISVGWVYKSKNQMKQVGTLSVMIYNLSFFGALLLGVIVGLSASNSSTNLSSTSAGMLGVLAGFLVWIIGFIVAFFLAKHPDGDDMTVGKTVWYIVGWHGPDRLRRMINSTNTPNWKPGRLDDEILALWKPHLVSVTFSFFIKYFIPAILFVLFFSTFKTDVLNKYEGYPWDYQILGYLIFSFMVFLVAFVAIFPRTMLDPRLSGSSSGKKQLCWTFKPATSKADKTGSDDTSEVYGGEVHANKSAVGLEAEDVNE